MEKIINRLRFTLVMLIVLFGCGLAAAQTDTRDADRLCRYFTSISNNITKLYAGSNAQECVDKILADSEQIKNLGASKEDLTSESRASICEAVATLYSLASQTDPNSEEFAAYKRILKVELYDMGTVGVVAKTFYDALLAGLNKNS